MYPTSSAPIPFQFQQDLYSITPTIDIYDCIIPYENRLRAWVDTAPDDKERKSREMLMKSILAFRKNERADAVFNGQAYGTTSMNLEGQDLTNLPPLDDLKHPVKMIYLGENKLRAIPARAFHGITGLNLLDLSGNNIQLVMPDAFHGLEEAREIRLCGNCLNDLDDESLRGLNVDCNVYLGWNKFSESAALGIQARTRMPGYQGPKLMDVHPCEECDEWRDSTTLAQLQKPEMTEQAESDMGFLDSLRSDPSLPRLLQGAAHDQFASLMPDKAPKMSLQRDNIPTVYKNLINLCILNTRYGPAEQHGHLQSLEQAKDAIKNIITVRTMEDPDSNEDIESRLKAFSPSAPIRILGGYPPGVDQTGQHAGHTVVYSIVCDSHDSVWLIVDNTGAGCYGDFSRMTFTVPWEKYRVAPADSAISKARALYNHLKAIRLGNHPFPFDGR
ncbi:leucine-rich repeat domain-containing protein [Endozoicomonas elysicola]|uniref:Uncharacterized protein n=1 Tax=Endozoicomonas elysicola TaxID=305900 RepID=A0A081KAS5_9GAMM|nr:leucine-rich repeat domain-containing protein [Endozoicomonas elysicola]KEI71251.1 hypothetical protein GV64_11305 [Endozoicomonas elysicola]